MKKVHLKSALPIYIAAAVWLLAGLIFPKLLMKLPGLLVTAAVSVVGYFVGSKLFPGRVIEMEEKIDTGDDKLNRDIEEGRARLEKMRQANAAIPHPGITASLNRMNDAGEQIFKELARDPSQLPQVRRFMNYYLPTAEKLAEQYRLLDESATKGENIESAMRRIESSMGMIADAFGKCADNLFEDEDMDIDAEIQVMKTMLAGDNLAPGGAGDIRQAAAAAAAAPAEPEKEEPREIKLTLGGQ